MNPNTLDELPHAQLREWLERALAGWEPLPRFTPDEPPYLGILRLDKQVKRATGQSLRDGCLHLLRRFCERGLGDSTYVRELLSLAAAFRQPETPEMLGDLARRFQQFPELPLSVRFAILGTLVDASPPRRPEFWQEVLRQDPENYAASALSGVLATDPFGALKLLAQMPDQTLAGQAAALKLDLAWDDLPSAKRHRFVEEAQGALMTCGVQFAAPVRAWAETKVAPTVNPGLRAALDNFLGPESAPRALTSKLCETDCLVS